MSLTASSFSLLRWHACFHAELLRRGFSPRAARQAMRRSLLAPLLYLIGSVAAFVVPALSLGIQIVVPIIYIVPQRTEGDE